MHGHTHTYVFTCTYKPILIHKKIISRCMGYVHVLQNLMWSKFLCHRSPEDFYPQSVNVHVDVHVRVLGQRPIYVYTEKVYMHMCIYRLICIVCLSFWSTFTFISCIYLKNTVSIRIFTCRYIFYFIFVRVLYMWHSTTYMTCISYDFHNTRWYTCKCE